MAMIKKIESMDFNSFKVIKLYDAYLKVVYWFFSYPNREIGLNDISQEIKIAKTTAKNIVNKLVEQGFLKREVIGRVWRISCNLKHKFNYSLKIGYNLAMVYESGILEEIHKTIKNPVAVILFGSYRKGDDNEKSDIDIAVETLNENELNISTLGAIPVFGYRKNVLVNLHAFSRKKIDLNLFANIANGIVLEGFLEVRQ